jgi:tRNA A37 N6-isopentenylltransferase MiaA
MKNTKIIILITTFILLCGCVNKDENKLVKYLKSINYDCLKNVCVYEPSDGNVKVKSVYDIDNTLYKKENNYSQIQSSFLEYNWTTNEVKYDYKVFAISMARELLYERINLRVDLMIKQGLVEEVRNLLNKYDHFPTAMQGLGYKEVKEYFDGILTYEEMIDKIKQESRHYAKRQLTWFRRNKEIVWLDKNDGMEKNVNTILEVL